MARNNFSTVCHDWNIHMELRAISSSFLTVLYMLMLVEIAQEPRGTNATEVPVN